MPGVYSKDEKPTIDEFVEHLARRVKTENK